MDVNDNTKVIFIKEKMQLNKQMGIVESFKKRYYNTCIQTL